MFNKQLFDLSFQQSLELLNNAEKITKETLKTLSRDILTAHHATQDIGYVTRLLQVLTPMNYKMCVLYFIEFTGFTWDEEESLFTKKNKKRYDKALAAAMALLEDPNQNVWTWAEKNVKMEAKPLELSKITQYFKGVLKKAEEQGIEQSKVIESVFAAGVDVDALIVALSKMEGLNIDIHAEQTEGMDIDVNVKQEEQEAQE